jgi:3-deoxy-7-phosphoheptulonate synthase
MRVASQETPMLIVMKPHATAEQIEAVKQKISSMGFTAHSIPGAQRVAIGVTGNRDALEAELFITMPGVADAVRVSQPFKLVSREVKEEDTVIDVGGVLLGGKQIVVMAGPCSVESKEQILEAAAAVKRAGAVILRGGAFNPGPAPMSFRGCARKV